MTAPTEIFLDHAAGGPLDPRVRSAMEPFLAAASPSGLHEAARGPADALAAARAQVARLIGGADEEVIFTSGATESRNLAIKGLWAANRRLGDRLVLATTEHPATRAAGRTLAARHGAALADVPVDGEGFVDPPELAATVDGETSVVSITQGQGDIGTLQDVPALVAAVRRAAPEARIHLDAGSSAGLVAIDAVDLGVDALTIGGPPLGAPPWAGALWVREGARLLPLIEGGIEEAGKRAGAPGMPGLVALGAAAKIAREEGLDRAARMAERGERLIAALLAVEDVRLNGPRGMRIPGHVQVSVGGVEGETLALALAGEGVACSPGSACTAHAGKAAPALEALGLEAPWTHSAVLFTLGPETSEVEVDRAADTFAGVVARLRLMSPIPPT